MYLSNFINKKCPFCKKKLEISYYKNKTSIKCEVIDDRSILFNLRYYPVDARRAINQFKYKKLSVIINKNNKFKIMLDGQPSVDPIFIDYIINNKSFFNFYQGCLNCKKYQLVSETIQFKENYKISDVLKNSEFYFKEVNNLQAICINHANCSKNTYIYIDDYKNIVYDPPFYFPTKFSEKAKVLTLKKTPMNKIEKFISNKIETIQTFI